MTLLPKNWQDKLADKRADESTQAVEAEPANGQAWERAAPQKFPAKAQFIESPGVTLALSIYTVSTEKSETYPKKTKSGGASEIPMARSGF